MRRLLPLVLVSVACSGQRPPPPSPIATPLTAAPPAVHSVEAKADAGSNPLLSLEKFSPLLSTPPLAPAGRLLAQGNPAGAAAAVMKTMHKSPPSGADVPRWQMLLARLREKAGDLRGAAASYELAAAADWPLSSYAWLGAGRVLLRSGHVGTALERLGHVRLDEPLADETRLLIAEAADRNGDHDLAIKTWRQHLQSGDDVSDRVDVSLKLAGALLDRAADNAKKPDAAKRADAGDAAPAPQEDTAEALRLARRVDLENTGSGSDALGRAQALEKRALTMLPQKLRSKLAPLTPEDQLIRVKALLGAGQDDGAGKAADRLLKSLPKKQRWSSVGCEVAVLRAKALAMKHKYGDATDSFAKPIRFCKGDDIRARLLYLAGRYAASDGRQMLAVKRYEQLQKELPHHRLADDARMHEAFSYYELGVEARFTQLLSSMPDDYPDGDMVLDGVFRLAMRRIEKGDWSGAASVLDRAATLATKQDSRRGTEFAGRERYFRARAWIATGEKQRGEKELAAIIRELPLSYYMLQAYSHLVALDPSRAKQALEAGIQRSKQSPFSFEYRPEFDTPGFRRAMELLRQGELELAQREIQALGIARPGAAPEILWGLALLYSRAGSAKLSHAVARGLLTDWLGRWPAGDWVKAWKLAFPRPYHAVVEREAKRTGVPETLIYAVMREESAFDPRAESPANAYGLMQLIVPTARLYARPLGLPYDARSLERPAVNITLGSHALAKLGNRFSNNPLLAIPAYNAGPGRPRRWLHDRPSLDFDVWVELIPFRETRRYTKRVLASRAAYTFLYDEKNADDAMDLPLKLKI
jgi:soluble lytic murein transglycosylase